MYKIEIQLKKFEHISSIKLFFLSCLKNKKKNFIIDGLEADISFKNLLDFFHSYSSVCNLQFRNIPFCLYNSKFPVTQDNSYNYKLQSICLSCSYAETCRWCHNNKDLAYLTPQSGNVVLEYREKIIHGLQKIYDFLHTLWFEYKEIVVFSHLDVLYDFLFLGKDMFFNALTNKYWCISEHERIYLQLSWSSRIDQIFINRWKNLIFKNIDIAEKFYNLLQEIDIDITLISWQYLEMGKQKKVIKISNYNLFMVVNEAINYNIVFNYKHRPDIYSVSSWEELHFSDAISCQGTNDVFKFCWKQKNIYKLSETVCLPVINISKKDFKDIPSEYILVGYDTNSKFMHEIIHAELVLLERKTDISHWAIVCREIKKDCIYDIPFITEWVSSYDVLSVNIETLEIQRL